MFEYIYVSDVKERQTLSIPKAFLGDSVNEGLSVGAKVLYALLCEKLMKQERGMARFEPDIACVELNCLADELYTWLHELEESHLLTKTDNCLIVNPIHYEGV